MNPAQPPELSELPTLAEQPEQPELSTPAEPAELPNYDQRLRSRLAAVHLSSWKALSRAAGVSEWQIQQLRRGKAAQMRVEPLCRISQALHIPLMELIAQFSTLPLPTSPNPEAPSEAIALEHALEQLKQEYGRLQTQLQAQRAALWQEFQQSSLQTLESWLLQYPTAAHAALQNPQVSASRLIPLMRPIEQLLKDWQIEAIAPVGAETAFDPQQHQLMEGNANPGDRVKIRYTGYRQGDKLLYRAKVSLLPPATT